MTTLAGSASTAPALSTAELEAVVGRRLGDPHPIRTLGHDARDRNGVRISRSLDHDLWLLRWPPGTRVTPHDHGDSAGAFSVLHGELIELRWQASVPECRLVAPGETVSFERGVVHDVVATNRVAYSIHAYSPPLEVMSFYDIPSLATRSGATPAFSHIQSSTTHRRPGDG